MPIQPEVIRSKYVNGRRVAPVFLFVSENSTDWRAGKITEVKIEQPSELGLLERAQTGRRILVSNRLTTRLP